MPLDERRGHCFIIYSTSVDSVVAGTLDRQLHYCVSRLVASSTGMCQ